MRTGNPKKKRTKGECRSCHEIRYFHGRRLCETCWAYAKKLGTLEQFPRLNDKELHGQQTCQCYSPIREELTMWGPGTAQCRKCGRPIIT